MANERLVQKYLETSSKLEKAEKAKDKTDSIGEKIRKMEDQLLEARRAYRDAEVERQKARQDADKSLEELDSEIKEYAENMLPNKSTPDHHRGHIDGTWRELAFITKKELLIRRNGRPKRPNAKRG